MKPNEFLTVATMAIRNLSRHKVKTIITTIAVTISVALYIAMDGWILGMNLDSRRNIISYETGAGKIQNRAYFEKKDEFPMYEAFQGWEEYAEVLEEAGYDSAPRFVFSGTLYSRSGSAPMLFNGVVPEMESRMLRYTGYLDAGRFPLPGRMEMAVGLLAADKLRIGIPGRIDAEEFENGLLSAAQTEEEKAFIRSAYEAPPEGAEDSRMRLSDSLTSEDTSRLWNILSASGRMDVRVSTVIDLKAAPEIIRGDRFEDDLLPLLAGENRELILSSYEKDPYLGDYILIAEEETQKEAALKAMLSADYSGAIRHVNQLMTFTVVGVINSPNPKTNSNVAYLPLDILQGDLGLMLDGKVTEILYRASDADDAHLPGKAESPEYVAEVLSEGLRSRGSRLPEEITTYSWLEYVEDYLAAARGDDVSTRVMIGFLFLLSFIGIANTMLMAILERTKEIGMMRALGMTNGQLIVTYAAEAGLVGLIGSLFGVALGCLINIPMVKYGVDYSAMSEQMGGDFGYRIVALFRSAWNPPVIIGTAIVAVLLSSLTALPPIMRTLKRPVTDSLRFE